LEAITNRFMHTKNTGKTVYKRATATIPFSLPPTFLWCAGHCSCMPMKRGKRTPYTPAARGMPLDMFLARRYREIDRSEWPERLKQGVKEVLRRAAANESTARKLATPKEDMPHDELMRTYANTLIKEFHQFIDVSTGKPVPVQAFIESRPFRPGRRRKFFGTKNETITKITALLKTKEIPDQYKRDIVKYLKQNKDRIPLVQMHRIQHYATGLRIAAKAGLLK
jgi:hypothetical protein